MFQYVIVSDDALSNLKTMKKIVVLFALVALVLTGCSEPKSAEEAAIEASGDISTSQWVTFEGDGFSFEYPANYKSDKIGLWTKEGYEKHINPPEECSVCQIPYVGVIQAKTPMSLDEYIIGKHQLPGTTLAEAEELSGVTFYEVVKIGDHEFTKVLVSDMFEVTTYYTRNDFTIVGFQTYFHEIDVAEFAYIMKTLKF